MTGNHTLLIVKQLSMNGDEDIYKKRGLVKSSLSTNSRKVRDSNPRYPKGVYRISSPARSITLPTFLLSENQ